MSVLPFRLFRCARGRAVFVYSLVAVLMVLLAGPAALASGQPEAQAAVQHQVGGEASLVFRIWARSIFSGSTAGRC
jgi:hypothetical protein